MRPKAAAARAALAPARRACLLPAKAETKPQSPDEVAKLRERLARLEEALKARENKPGIVEQQTKQQAAVAVPQKRAVSGDACDGLLVSVATGREALHQARFWGELQGLPKLPGNGGSSSGQFHDGLSRRTSQSTRKWRAGTAPAQCHDRQVLSRWAGCRDHARRMGRAVRRRARLRLVITGRAANEG